MTRLRFWTRRDVVSATSKFAALWLVGIRPKNLPLGQEYTAESIAQLLLVCRKLSCPVSMTAACQHSLGVATLSSTDLSSEILSDLLSAKLDCSSTAAILNSLRERSSQDFAEGRIRLVDGWILSVTEVRAYALAHYAT